MVRKGGDPVVTHGWFVCPTVSMVTTSHATGLEKTLLGVWTVGGTGGLVSCFDVRDSFVEVRGGLIFLFICVLFYF